MKKLLFTFCALALLMSTMDVQAKQTHVKSYHKKSGTHVSAHTRRVGNHKKHR